MVDFNNEHFYNIVGCLIIVFLLCWMYWTKDDSTPTSVV